jgi:hypothetical protein
MKTLLIILGSLYILTQPSTGLGKIYEYTDEDGTPAYTNSLDTVVDSKIEQYRPMLKKLTPSNRLSENRKDFLRLKKHQIETFVLEMPLLERLILGIGSAIFGLAAIYALFFRPLLKGSAVRILFRMTLILFVLGMSILSYFAITRSLSPETYNDQASLSNPSRD